jgi:hypothetical protein
MTPHRRSPPHRDRRRPLGAWLRPGLRAVALPITVALTLHGAPGQAQTAPPPYAAEALYRAADGSESAGRVIKSGADMRLEFTQAGKPVIQIIRRAEGVMYVLDPATRSWFEVRGAADPTAANPGYAPPCETDSQAQGLTCRFIGNETSSGISAEVWEVSQPGQPQPSRVLWDGARRRALRQDYPDGTVMALAFIAMEELGGRRAEHWSLTVTQPGQAPRVGSWYFDPELRVELREELPTGELRSLENITVGAIDASAFQVPEGWTQIVPPNAPAGAPAPN